ncbi:hypothetical protein BDC45DRAFT_535712 [Circinella umbellata]|nr:hypothetical protein BDC45DRAFT_535712 [Circinella umbellata]
MVPFPTVRLLSANAPYHLGIRRASSDDLLDLTAIPTFHSIDNTITKYGTSFVGSIMIFGDHYAFPSGVDRFMHRSIVIDETWFKKSYTNCKIEVIHQLMVSHRNIMILLHTANIKKKKHTMNVAWSGRRKWSLYQDIMQRKAYSKKYPVNPINHVNHVKSYMVHNRNYETI